MAKQKELTPISVHDKEVAALGATVEEQDMSSLPRVIVPMGSFTDPNNADASEGSVNMNLDSHPVEHAEDYGADVQPGEHIVLTTMDTESEFDTSGAKTDGAEVDPTDREQWSKDQWKDHLSGLDLPVSGNMATLKERVEEYEAQEAEYENMNSEDWKEAVGEAQSVEDLDELKAAYDRSGAEYTTVETAFEDRRTELTDQK